MTAPRDVAEMMGIGLGLSHPQMAARSSGIYRWVNCIQEFSQNLMVMIDIVTIIVYHELRLSSTNL